MENVCFDIPSRRKTQVFPFSVPVAQMFSIVACWTQESVSLRVICLSCYARIMFFKPGSGNFFQCVIEGFSIITHFPF